MPGLTSLREQDGVWLQSQSAPGGCLEGVLPEVAGVFTDEMRMAGCDDDEMNGLAWMFRMDSSPTF